MRRTATTGILAAFLASNLFLLATGCGAGADGGETRPAVTAPYSGEEVFRGLFFAEGPVSHSLLDVLGPRGTPPQPTVAELEHTASRMKEEGWSQGTIEQIQAAIEAMKEGRPLPETSPDRVALVRDAIVQQVKDSDPTFFERFGAAMQSGDQVRVEAAFTEAQDKVRKAVDVIGRTSASGGSHLVAVIAIAVVVVAVAVFVWVLASHEEQSQRSKLGRDELIQSLTLRLAR